MSMDVYEGTINIVVRNKENTDYILVKNIECNDGFGENDGWTALKLLQQNHTIKIKDENQGETTPFVTVDGEDKFHLGYSNYGEFDYLLSLDKFNKIYKKLKDCWCILEEGLYDKKSIIDGYNEFSNNYLTEYGKLIDCQELSPEEKEIAKEHYEKAKNLIKETKEALNNGELFVRFTGEVS